MRKQIYKLLGLAAAIAIIPSCMDTLDTHPKESYNEETVWGSKSTADGFVYATYEQVLNNTDFKGGIGWEARTPNGIYCDQVSGSIDHFTTEHGISTGSDFGISKFGTLRRCNLIIRKATESTVFTEDEKKELIAHGHFLRGLVFFDQTRKMGRFVPIKEVLGSTDNVAAEIPMTKDIAESYSITIADLEKGANELPETSSAGIANSYAAKVILSRACLQAYAYTDNEEYLDKAIKAAKEVVEAKELTENYGGMFNETDPYNPEILWGYYRLSTNTSIGSYSELISVYPNIGTDNTTNSKCPIGLNNKTKAFEGWATYFPTQDLVDQYLAIDEVTGEAVPWWETSQYKASVEELVPSTITKAGQIDSYSQVDGNLRRMPTPNDLENENEGYPHFIRYARLKEGVTGKDISDIIYANRDKRLATSVVYDKVTWGGETIELNLGGNFSQGVRDKEDGGWYNTVTGYYWRKNTIEEPDPRAYVDTKTDMHFCLARVGEAWMNLVEAYLLKDEIGLAVDALNETRTTHGGLPESKASTKEEAWKDYIRERNVEMVNEGGDLYFSYLRWGKYGGPANDGRAPGDVILALDKPVYKIEMDRKRQNLLIGQVTLLGSAQRSFTTRRYLLPINQGFLNTREAYGLDHKQTENW